MFGLYLIGIILFVVIVVILLIIEVAFWVIVIGSLGAIALFLWATGLHEVAIGLGLAVAIMCGAGWGTYRLIKWDIDRLGAPPRTQERSLAWRIHDLMNAPFPTRSSSKPKVEAPPVDPEERFLWANRLGRYADAGAEKDAEDGKTDR